MSKEEKLSSNDKRRRTTLRKKSVDELVNIVFRKDDIERKLQKSIETFKNLQDVNEKRINNLKDSLNKSEEIQVAQEQTISEYKKDCENYANDCDSISKSLAARTKECRILFYIIVVLIIALISSIIFL